MNLFWTRVLDKYLGIPLCFFLGLFARRKGYAADCRPETGILLVKFWGLGNVVMMLPAIRALRKAFPNVPLYLYTLQSNQGLVAHDPDIQEVIVVDAERWFGFLKSCIGSLLRIRRLQADLILDFEQFARISSVLGMLSGIPRRIGFRTTGQGRHYAYTDLVRYNNEQHMVETFADIVRSIGVAVDTRPQPIVAGRRARQAFAARMHDLGISPKQRIVGMHLGSGDNFVERRWPAGSFGLLADHMIGKYGFLVLFTGTADETPLVAQALQAMRHAPRAIDLSGSLSLEELSAMMDVCAVFVANDTGPLHVASAAGVPVIGFYGPNTPVLYGPRGGSDLLVYRAIPCSPCITNYNAKTSRCTDPVCILRISVKDVLKKVDQYFSDVLGIVPLGDAPGQQGHPPIRLTPKAPPPRLVESKHKGVRPA